MSAKPKSKKELEGEISYWKWQASTLSENTKPWLLIPGLIVFVNTENMSDINERLDILEMALKNLRTPHPTK